MTIHSLILLACFSSPLFYGIIQLSGQPLAFTDILLPACALSWMVQKRHQWTGITRSLACFAAAALVSTVEPFAEGGHVETLLKVTRLVGIVAPAVLLTAVRCTHEDWQRYLWAFFAGGALSLILGIAGFFYQWEQVIATQTYMYDGGAYLHRAGGVFRDSGAYGHLLATWFACSYLLLASELGGWRRLALLASMAVITPLGLYGSVSRSAALNIGSVLALALMLRTSGRQVLRRLLQGLSGLVLGGLALAVLLADADTRDALLSAGETVTQRLSESFSALLGGVEDIERASGGRLTTWVSALDAWATNPVVGVGYKTLSLTGNPPDNSFVLALCETGILGFAALAFFFGLVFVRALDRHSRGDDAGRYFLILWLGQLVHCLNADIFTFFGSVTPLLIITAIWYRLSSHPVPHPVRSLAGRGVSLLRA